MLKISKQSKKALENLTKDFQKGELILLGGRPGTGKSTAVLNLALIEILKNDKVIALFNYEMSSKVLIPKMLDIIDELDIKSSVRNNKVKPDLKKTNIYIEDSPQNTIEDIVRRSKEIASTNKLDLIIIDYLQLIAISQPCKNPHEEARKHINRLKKLAKELNVTIIITSQLARKSDNNAPEVNDLKVNRNHIDKIIFLDYQGNIYYHANINNKASIIANIKEEKK